MLLVLYIVFSVLVISQIECIGVGRWKGGGGGEWGAEGQPFGLKQQCCAFVNCYNLQGEARLA